MEKTSKIYVAGHRGLAGSAIMRRLKDLGYNNLVHRSHRELDLTTQEKVEEFFAREKPEHVFLAAGKVGGIWANSTYPAEFIYNNLAIITNIIHASYIHGVKKLLFLGSSCIYPKHCPQPIKEEYLLSGYLEQSNEPYAIAKIAGIKMCHSYNRQYGTRFIPVMPTNLYGPKDNFDLRTSHVLPALIRKFHLAKMAFEKNQEAIALDEDRFGAMPEGFRASLGIRDQPANLITGTSKPGLTLWGTGIPKREFLYVEDLADACIFLMSLPETRFSSFSTHSSLLFNIGTGKDLTIRDLAGKIAGVVGFDGEVHWDSSKPDGTPQKLLDISSLSNLGWQAKTDLKNGIKETYKWYNHEILKDAA